LSRWGETQRDVRLSGKMNYYIVAFDIFGAKVMNTLPDIIEVRMVNDFLQVFGMAWSYDINHSYLVVFVE
jgi:hypothetical protein